MTLLLCAAECMYASSPSQDLYKQEAKSLSELSIDEVCQWFTSIGLQKCLPLIRGKTSYFNSSPSFSLVCSKIYLESLCHIK